MKRNTRLFIVLGIAVVTAALASFGVNEAIIRRPLPPGDPMIDVVVAAQAIEMGVSLTKERVKVIAWPARNQIAGAFANVADVVDRGLVAPVAENEPITKSKLAPKEAGGGLPIIITNGMRAMSVKVNEVIGVAGFVTPKTRVDVIVTLRQNKDSLSCVVVSNVEVLTAGTRYDEEARKDGKPIQSTVVTLMVSPADAERISLAASEGQIMLALRNPLDRDVTLTSCADTARLTARSAPPERVTPRPRVVRDTTHVPPPPPPPPPAEKKVFKKCISGKCTEEIL